VPPAPLRVETAGRHSLTLQGVVVWGAAEVPAAADGLGTRSERQAMRLEHEVARYRQPVARSRRLCEISDNPDGPCFAVSCVRLTMKQPHVSDCLDSQGHRSVSGNADRSNEAALGAVGRDYRAASVSRPPPRTPNICGCLDALMDAFGVVMARP
jgi:hypothetical protein